MKAVLLALAVLAAALPGAARAATPRVDVTLYGDPGHIVAGGLQQRWSSDDEEIQVDLFQGRTLTVGVGPEFDAEVKHWFTFSPPSGRVLEPGVYRDPLTDYSVAWQVPYVGISAQYGSVHLNCPYIEWGAFEVRELELGDDGQVNRAWIVFEDRCGIKPQGAYGEIRIGMPPPATVPSIVRWPAYDAGHGGTPSRVTVAAGATAARIVGEDAEEFSIAEDGCRSAPPGPCDLLVSYRTLAPGTKRAWLELDHPGGGRTDVPLQGYAYGGETSLTLVSDPGDWIGEGRNYRYGPEYYYWFNSYKPSYLRGDLARTWGFKFEDPTGAPIVAKTYADAVESGGGSGPIMEVSGGPSLHACASVSGSFTVHEITHGPYEEIRTLALSFVQHCDRGIPALRGTLKHRAGDETPLAPWLVDAPSVTPLGTPPGGGPTPTPSQSPSLSPDPATSTPALTATRTPFAAPVATLTDVTRPRVTVLRSVATGATLRVSEPVRLTATLRSCRRACHTTRRTFTLAAGRHTLSARRLAGRSRFTRGRHTLRFRVRDAAGNAAEQVVRFSVRA